MMLHLLAASSVSKTGRTQDPHSMKELSEPEKFVFPGIRFLPSAGRQKTAEKLLLAGPGRAGLAESTNSIIPEACRLTFHVYNGMAQNG